MGGNATWVVFALNALVVFLLVYIGTVWYSKNIMIPLNAKTTVQFEAEGVAAASVAFLFVRGMTGLVPFIGPWFSALDVIWQAGLVTVVFMIGTKFFARLLIEWPEYLMGIWGPLALGVIVASVPIVQIGYSLLMQIMFGVKL